MNPHTALVTGATGFVGGRLVDRLLRDGVHVTILLRPESRVPERWQKRVAEIVCADFSVNGLRAVLAGRAVGQIYHLAAYGVRPQDRDASRMVAVNTVLPSSIVQLASECGASIVMAGSCAEYAPPEKAQAMDENAPLEFERLYGATKAAGGLAAAACACAYGVTLRYLRLFHIYGPGEAGHRLLPNLVARLSRGEPVPLSDGHQIRDFVHVDDAVSGLIAAAGHAGAATKPIIANLCSGMGHRVQDFAREVARALNAPEQLLQFGAIERRADEIPFVVGNGNKARDIFGYQQRYEFSDGVAQAVAEMTGTNREAARVA